MANMVGGEGSVVKGVGRSSVGVDGVQADPLCPSDKTNALPSVSPHGTDGSGEPSAVPGFLADGEHSGGRSACLDLIKEHLTDSLGAGGASTRYRPMEMNGEVVPGWSCPEEWRGPDGEKPAVVLKVQEFESGGFEATCRYLDVERIGRLRESGGHRGPRVQAEEVNAEHVRIASQRAKQRVRYLVKNMGADHLVTLTRREGEDKSGWWAEREWAVAWDKARRSLVKVVGEFPYVAVLEYHEKGNCHLHIAWKGKVPVNLIRPLWWSICGGRGQGNVDAKWIKSRTPALRAERIASYISKYVVKSFERSDRFNKKRYWATKQILAVARRFILRSGDVNAALVEAAEMFELDLVMFLKRDGLGKTSGHFFDFPDGSGWWLAYMPELHGGAPVPF